MECIRFVGWVTAPIQHENFCKILIFLAERHALILKSVFTFESLDTVEVFSSHWKRMRSHSRVLWAPHQLFRAPSAEHEPSLAVMNCFSGGFTPTLFQKGLHCCPPHPPEFLEREVVSQGMWGGNVGQVHEKVTKYIVFGKTVFSLLFQINFIKTNDVLQMNNIQIFFFTNISICRPCCLFLALSRPVCTRMKYHLKVKKPAHYPDVQSI